MYACEERHAKLPFGFLRGNVFDQGFLFYSPVTLSKEVNSSSFLTVRRSATEHHVCADGWQETLSQLACKQMGLG